MVLREVLHVQNAGGESSGTAGSIKLHHTVNPSVAAYAAVHGFVLFDAGFAQFQPQVQQFRYNALRLRCLFLHELFRKALHRRILIGEPCLQLHYAAGVFQPRQFLCTLIGCLGKCRIDRDGVFDELVIHLHAAIVDLLIQCVQFPFLFRERVLFQLLSNGALRFDVLRIVLLVNRPFVGRVDGQIARAPAVRLGRLTGHGEIADEVFALVHLLL